MIYAYLSSILSDTSDGIIYIFWNRPVRHLLFQRLGLRRGRRVSTIALGHASNLTNAIVTANAENDVHSNTLPTHPISRQRKVNTIYQNPALVPGFTFRSFTDTDCIVLPKGVPASGGSE